LATQLNQSKINQQLSKERLVEVRRQLTFLSEGSLATSHVQDAFVKERVNEKLSELH